MSSYIDMSKSLASQIVDDLLSRDPPTTQECTGAAAASKGRGKFPFFRRGSGSREAASKGASASREAASGSREASASASASRESA